MKPLISLIIPVYNVEKYFAKCMETVLAQTYENFEVILVDDGSTDNSGKMCDEYAKENARIRVFHQANAGQAAARNYGIQIASGKLIAFVDADDYIIEDYLEYLYCLMKEYSAEIACGQYKRVSSENIIVDEPRISYNSYCVGTEGALKRLCLGDKINPISPCKLYKRELFNDISFPAGEVYEDVATIYRLMGECKTVAVGERLIYYYVQRANSTVHKPIDEEKLYGLIAVENEYLYIKDRFPNVVEAAHIRCAIMSLEYALRAVSDKENGKYYFGEVKKYLHRHLKYVIRSSYVTAFFKMRCAIASSNYSIARALLLFAEKLRATVRKCD